MRRLWKEQTPDLIGHRLALYQTKGTVKVKSIEAVMPRQWQRSGARNRGAPSAEESRKWLYSLPPSRHPSSVFDVTLPIHG